MGSSTLSKSIFVVIPAFNEFETITMIVSKVSALGYPIVVVNDCSEDNTALLAEQAGANVLNLTEQAGAWRATQKGMEHALSLGAELIITLDADGQHRPSDINTLVAHLNALNEKEHKCDIVIGSCPERGSKARHIAWQLFRLVTGLTMTDLTSGFRLYTAHAINTLIKAGSKKFLYQDIAILLLARKQGLKVAEVAVQMKPRIDGKSRIFSSWFKVAYYMMYTFLVILFRR